MSFVNKLEVTFAKWNESLPHLPMNVKQWLADYAWLLSTITVVIIVVALFASIPQLLTSIALSSAFNLFTPSAYYYENPVGLAWATTTLVMTSFFVNAVLISMAVSLLKDKQKRGWDIIFLAYMISWIAYVAGGLMIMNGVILFAAAVEAFVAGYLVFEVRQFFLNESVVEKLTVNPRVVYSDKTHRHGPTPTT